MEIIYKLGQILLNICIVSVVIYLTSPLWGPLYIMIEEYFENRKK